MSSAKNSVFADAPQVLVPATWQNCQVYSEDELIGLGRENLTEMSAYWRNQADRLSQQMEADASLDTESARNDRQAMWDRACYLNNLVERAESKPCFAYARPTDWFRLEDQVRLFAHLFCDGVVTSQSNRVVDAIATGRVIYGDQKQREGVVLILTDNKIHDCKDGFEGHGVWLQHTNPAIMLEWEYEYFQENPDYLHTWLRCTPNNEHLDLGRFKTAIIGPPKPISVD